MGDGNWKSASIKCGTNKSIHNDNGVFVIGEPTEDKCACEVGTYKSDPNSNECLNCVNNAAADETIRCPWTNTLVNLKLNSKLEP